MIRVLVVDDHSIFREGLKLILGETLDIRVEGEAAGPREALTLVEQGTWDVLLMDLSMPEGGGLEILRQVRAREPDLPVLVLSMYPEEQYAIPVLRAGAGGYLNKEAAPEDLVRAVRKVASGGKFISPAVAERLAAQLEAGSVGLPHEALSEREFQVLRLLASGQTVGEIAEALSLSVKTISTYRARVLEKMQMHTNAELTRYAIEHQLV
jgi:two-component system invasion response regulator UvrY